MIETLKDYIKANVPELKAVGEAVDFQTAAESNPLATPACYVFLMDETPGPSQTDVLIQKVRATVGIVLVVKNLKDTKGAAAKVTVDSLRTKVKDLVFGWSASAVYDPFERGPGRLLAFRDGHLWWQDLYLTEYFDRSSL